MHNQWRELPRQQARRFDQLKVSRKLLPVLAGLVSDFGIKSLGQSSGARGFR
jgi:hypothetical protein